MTKLIRLLSPAAALLAAAGCGDNHSTLDTTPDAGPDYGGCETPIPEPEGLLVSPDELDRTLCQPGALAGVQPEGLWFLSMPGGGYFSSGSPVRFDRCGTQLQAKFGFVVSMPAYASLDDDDLFMRQYFEWSGGSRTVAATLCGRDEEGNLVGHFKGCFAPSGMDPICQSGEIRFDPFGRIPGEETSQGLELVTTWRGSADAPWGEGLDANVRVVDGIAYMVRGTDGLRIIDVRDPASPIDLGHFPAESDDFNDIKVVDGPEARRYALVSSAVLGVIVIDVTDPATPTQVAIMANPAPSVGSHTVFVETLGETTYAYVVDGFTPILGIFDVTNPAEPHYVGGYDTGDFNWGIHDVYVSQGRVYINAAEGGLIIIDTQPDPAQPVFIGQYQPEIPTYSHANWVTTVAGRTITVHGDEGYGAHLKIIDVDPESPEFMQVLGEFKLRDEVSVHNMIVIGDRAYVAWYQDGVRVIDLSDPTQPTQAGYYNLWDPAQSSAAFFEGTIGIDVHPDSGLIYATDTQKGLAILRIVE